MWPASPAPDRPRARASSALAVALLLAVAVTGTTAAAEPSSSPSPSASAEPAPSASPSPSPEAAPSGTPAPSPSDSVSPSPSPSPSGSPAPTADPSPSSSPSPEPSPSATPSPSPATFSINLYRSRAFVRQYTDRWCVAAATMTMANTLRVIRRSDGWVDRTYARQAEIISYARRRDTLPYGRGSDPRGWAAALRRFGGGMEYRERSFASYGAAVRYAAERIRTTGKPVGILAAHGGHAWIMHGFTASADPATTDDFIVLSVWVTGPLAGTDPRNGRLSSATFMRRWGRYLQRDGYRGWYKRWLLVSA